MWTQMRYAICDIHYDVRQHFHFLYAFMILCLNIFPCYLFVVCNRYLFELLPLFSLIIWLKLAKSTASLKQITNLYGNAENHKRISWNAKKKSRTTFFFVSTSLIGSGKFVGCFLICSSFSAYKLYTRYSRTIRSKWYTGTRFPLISAHLWTKRSVHLNHLS